MKTKRIYTTLILEDAKQVRAILEEAGIKVQSSSGHLNEHIYLNSASAQEYTISVEELYYVDAKYILEKNGIEVLGPEESKSDKEVDYMHDSLRLAIFGMIFVPVILNLLSLYKFGLGIKNKEQFKIFRVTQIIVLNIIGLAFWSTILYNKYFLSQ
ncbi:hypothetical protein ABMA79_02820 [Halobacteriovorax sp. HFRX-2_2]|uniref:hypothetical protein n=1 Tax=unclassified Halobacteriovorax TaxID=2639665 RepID=UPI0037249AE8